MDTNNGVYYYGQEKEIALVLNIILINEMESFS